jgi:hypothetical protein
MIVVALVVVAVVVPIPAAVTSPPTPPATAGAGGNQRDQTEDYEFFHGASFGEFSIGDAPQVPFTRRLIRIQDDRHWSLRFL